jgi:hypothetical protein
VAGASTMNPHSAKYPSVCVPQTPRVDTWVGHYVGRGNLNPATHLYGW